MKTLYQPVYIYLNIFISVEFWWKLNVFFIKRHMLMLEKSFLLYFLTIKIYIKEEVTQHLNYQLCCRFCISIHYALTFPI